MARKPGGRKTIPMALIQNTTRRSVTFAKRRNGVFKKADEITTLCGAQVGVIAFSPAGKPFTYGSPDLETVTNRLLNIGGGSGSIDGSVEALGGGGGVRKLLNEDLNQIQWQREVEKKRGKDLQESQRVEESGGACWWRKSPDTEAELVMWKDSMEELRLRVEEEAEKLRVAEEAEKLSLAEVAAAMTSLQFIYGGSSSTIPNIGGAGPSSAVPNMYGGSSSLANPNIGGARPSSAAPNMYGGGSSLANPNIGGAGPSSATPNMYGGGSSLANPNFGGAGPSSAAPNMYGGGSSLANPNIGGAGPSSAAPNMYGGGDGGSGGFGYGQQGPF